MSNSQNSTATAGNANTSNQKTPLLHAWHDPLANIKTNNACVRLVDLNCDGDSKLCVCDYDKKMRVYKGTNLVVEYAILDVPTAMCITYMEASLPRMPAVAVAAGSHVFIYRQLRPYRRWTCPALEISQSEQDVWNDLKSDGMTTSAAVKRLSELRDTGTVLSSRSSELLSLDSEESRMAFVEEMKDVNFVQHTVITCMEILKKDSEDSDALSLLIVGTESGHVYILPVDPTNSNYLCKIVLPSAPSLLSVSGNFDVEWRINVICRDGKMYSIKNGEVRGTAVLVGSSVDLGAQAVSVARQDKSIWVATMDRNIVCYSNRGKRLKGMILSEDIVELCMISLKRAKFNYLLLVALATGEICMYKELTNIYSFKVDRPVISLAYGVYGREENSLVVVHGPGAITIKMWRRTADVDSLNFNAGPPPEQDIPLPVPKKTKLYVEQTQREREKAPEIHRAFQRDLCKLRLTTARAYVKTLTDGLMSSSSIGSHDIRIQVQVQGLGPKFVLRVIFQNSGSQPLLQARLVFTYDTSLYSMGYEEASSPSIFIPVLLPGPKLILETQIMSVDPQGRSGQVLCLLYPTSGNIPSLNPILTASVKMPAAEPLLM